MRTDFLSPLFQKEVLDHLAHGSIAGTIPGILRRYQAFIMMEVFLLSRTSLLPYLSSRESLLRVVVFALFFLFGCRFPCLVLLQPFFSSDKHTLFFWEPFSLFFFT